MWIQDIICVAQTPKLLRVTEMLGGDGIRAVAVGNAVFVKKGKPVTGRHKPPTDIGDGPAVRKRVLGRWKTVVTACYGEHYTSLPYAGETKFGEFGGRGQLCQYLTLLIVAHE